MPIRVVLCVCVSLSLSRSLSLSLSPSMFEVGLRMHPMVSPGEYECVYVMHGMGHGATGVS